MDPAEASSSTRRPWGAAFITASRFTDVQSKKMKAFWR